MSEPAPAPVAAVRDLVFDYPTARALFGISFTIPRGSITALVGPNGAGKTTLLRCLAALEPPFSGQVLVDGLDTADAPREIHRTIGYLADDFGVYAALSVARCLRHAAAMRGVPADQEVARAHASAERLGIADRWDTPAGSLSRGLRQRLGIAQAILHRPRLLLLDEPASGLDPEARAQLSALFLRLRDDGMTLVVSSHILAELADYSTEMLILDRGHVVEHRSLGAAPGDRAAAHAPRALVLRLADAADGLGERLAAVSGVGGLEVDGATARFLFHGDDADQARLLADLVRDGFAVAEFGHQERNLQNLYLDRLRSVRGDAGPAG